MKVAYYVDAIKLVDNSFREVYALHPEWTAISWHDWATKDIPDILKTFIRRNPKLTDFNIQKLTTFAMHYAKYVVDKNTDVKLLRGIKNA